VTYNSLFPALDTTNLSHRAELVDPYPPAEQLAPISMWSVGSTLTRFFNYHLRNPRGSSIVCNYPGQNGFLNLVKVLQRGVRPWAS